MITKPLLAVAAEMDKISYPVLATPKLDGIRAIAIDGKILSRKFKLIPNKFIQRELASKVVNGLDGEIMLRDPKATFQDITSAVMSHEGEPDYVYCVFDRVKDSLDTPYHERVRKLCSIFCNHYADEDRLRIVKPVLIRDRDALDAYEAKCLAEGYEGIMIRNPNGRYKCGRSTVNEGILLKVKRFEDSEARIINLIERLENQNEQERDELGYAKRSKKKEGMVGSGTLGSFEVEDLKTGAKFCIGSGLDDNLRKKFWKNRDSYIGKIITYKFQPIGVKEKTPRFPIFKGLRAEIDMS